MSTLLPLGALRVPFAGGSCGQIVRLGVANQAGVVAELTQHGAVVVTVSHTDRVVLIYVRSTVSAGTHEKRSAPTKEKSSGRENGPLGLGEVHAFEDDIAQRHGNDRPGNEEDEQDRVGPIERVGFGCGADECSHEAVVERTERR